MKLTLRPYQKIAVEKIDIEHKKGNRKVLFVSATGSGKTETMAYMIERALKYKFPVVFIVRGRNLVNNASDRLYKNGIDHSVYMAGKWNRNASKLVQVCSVDTLVSRNDWPFKDKKCLVILDEAHFDYSKVFDAYPNSFFIGATGTPFTDMSVYDSYVQTIEPYELRDMEFLVPDKFYAPHIMDTSSVSIKMGDFDKKQLASVVTSSAVVGNIVEDWKEMGQDRPTILFATNIEHSLQLKQAFCDAGIKAIHCDAKSSDEERVKARKDLESGKIKIICNVDIFSTGWDCPAISCVILARPTWSLTWFLQAIGRGLRPYTDKSNCIIIDSAGNCLRHGTAYRIREISLDKPIKRKSRAYETRITTCFKCYFAYDPTQHDACPECGTAKEPGGKGVNCIDGKLIEYEESPQQKAEMRRKMIISKYHELEWGRKSRGLHPEHSFVQLFRLFTREEMVHLQQVTRVPARFLPL